MKRIRTSEEGPVFFEEKGFRFDTGPTWYLMPDVFERYFSLLGYKPEDYLKLHKLQPTYRVYFHGRKDPVDMFSDGQADLRTADSLEPGGAEVLRAYLDRASKQYRVMNDYFLYRNYRTPLDLLSKGVFPALKTLPILGSVASYVSRSFKSKEMRQLLEYSVVFLGSSPYKAPALYGIMSHVDLNMGAFYPEGGIHALVEALAAIGREKGVEYHTGVAVKRICVEKGRSTGVELQDGQIIDADIVLSNADIRHTENHLLDMPHRSYSCKYWDSRVLAPSAFMLFLGIKGELPELRHHTLYFSKDWQKNFRDIFDEPVWPEDPSLYVCASSRTDRQAAPAGHESLMVLVPIAAGLKDDESQRQEYRQKVINLLEERMGITDLHSRIVYEKIYSPSDYESLYNSHKGTALGLSHTITQTAIFRPKNKSRKVKNLYYTGSGTHPGIGLPVCLISAELACQRIMKEQL